MHFDNSLNFQLRTCCPVKHFMMDKTKAKLAAFFDNGDEETSFLVRRTVDDTKLSQFTSGSLRKTRREKEQEAADAKKREEEASAAQAYAEFLNAFEGEGVNRRKTGSGFVGAESKAAYIPSMPASDRAKLKVCRFPLFDRSPLF